MSKWNFRALEIDQEGKTIFVDLSPARKEKIGEYTEALETAAKSNIANPSFSKYFVRESVKTVYSRAIPAGNIEYGLCQALHGEESAVASFRAQWGRTKDKEIILGSVAGNRDDVATPHEKRRTIQLEDFGVDKKIVLGIIAGSPGNIATPCGNCRDILLEDFGDNLEIVSGAPNGGLAIVTNMKQYLCPDFRETPVSSIPSDVMARCKIAIRRGAQLVNDAYSPKDVRPERRYHALIKTQNKTYIGARDIMCDYHPVYALRDAIRQARRNNDPFVHSVVIVCEDFGGGIPQVMYKDRQHLLELNLQAELVTGKENDPTILIMTHNPRGKIVSAWLTTVKKWLPLPFTPRNFGPEFIEGLTKYFKGLKKP